MYKPTYCCECGEQIERVEWHLLTNRRFCQLCETEFKLEDLIRKFSAVGLLFVGIFGFGSYLSSGDRNLVIDTSKRSNLQEGRRSRKTISEDRPNSVNARRERHEKGKSVKNKSTGRNFKETQEVTAKSGKMPANTTSRLNPQKVEAGPVYFCGALTKKGTPCSRKVKGGGRCWQHQGQKALLTDKELRIKD